MEKQRLIQFKGVKKILGKTMILDGINFSVSAGEVVGITGANGSGKTTILRQICGFLYPDQGEVIVSNEIVEPGLVGKIPTGIGALIETPTFLPQFTGFQNLALLAGIQEKIGKETIKKSLKMVGLEPMDKKKVRKYSQGMLQRLGIAQAIMEEPKILLLDEPTNGLDKDGVDLFRQILEKQINDYVAIILVSHIEEEISRFCDKVYLLKDGKLELIQKQKQREWIILVRTVEELEQLSYVLTDFRIIKRVDGFATGQCKGEWESKQELLAFLMSYHIIPEKIMMEEEVVLC